MPTKMGGLGILIPSKVSDTQYENSRNVTNSLTNHVINQKVTIEIEKKEQKKIKLDIKNNKRRLIKNECEQIKAELSADKLKLFEATTEQGASSWLQALPLKLHDFYLDKQSFFDSLFIRYGIPLRKLPIRCVCGSSFSIDHALSCKRGGFILIRHNNIRDMTADFLSEICKDVKVEPALTPLSGEVLSGKSANKSDEARLDVAARGFWERGRNAFFDIRVFNPLAKSHSQKTLAVAHRSNEKEKKREYAERVLEVEHGSFSPLVFTCFGGGMAPECSMFYKRLSARIAEKRSINNSIATSWIKTKLSFGLLRTALLCIRGSRSHKANSPENFKDCDLKIAVSATRILI
jgi:hypothetical protein